MLETISGLMQMATALVGLEFSEKVVFQEKSVRLKTDRFGYLCLNFRRPVFYISPNGSMWSSTFLVGNATHEQKLDAVRRRTIFGLKPENLSEMVSEKGAWKEYLMFLSDRELSKGTSCNNCGHSLTRFESYHTNVCIKCLTSELRRLLEEQKHLKVAIYPVQEKLDEANKKVRTFRERICRALVRQDPSEIYDDHSTVDQDLLIEDENERQEWLRFIRSVGLGGA